MWRTVHHRRCRWAARCRGRAVVSSPTMHRRRSFRRQGPGYLLDRFLRLSSSRQILRSTLRGHHCHGQRLGINEPARAFSGAGHRRAGHWPHVHLRPPDRRGRPDPSTGQSRTAGMGGARIPDRRRATPPPGAASRLIHPTSGARRAAHQFPVHVARGPRSGMGQAPAGRSVSRSRLGERLV